MLFSKIVKNGSSQQVTNILFCFQEKVKKEKSEKPKQEVFFFINLFVNVVLFDKFLYHGRLSHGTLLHYAAYVPWAIWFGKSRNHE